MMNFLNRIGQALSKFMAGRYGTDSLNRFLTMIWAVFAVLNVFARSPILYIPEFLLFLLVFYRMLSKNTVKRRRENAAYYGFSVRIRKGFQKTVTKWTQRKSYRFFKCPACKADIRMPKKSGKFNIRCSKCSHLFQREFE